MSLRFFAFIIIFSLLGFLFLTVKPGNVYAACSVAGTACGSTAGCVRGGGNDENPEADCAAYSCQGGVCVASTVTPRATTTPGPRGSGQTCQSGTGIETAIGCVPTNPSQFILAVSRLLTGAGGGIALLLMIAGSFRMITSGGNPDAVKAGSEQFTSALIGLLFIVFAVLLLKVIGVDILNIPGFAGPS